MGSTTYDPGAYRSYATATAHHTTASYTARGPDPEFDPTKWKIRESRISDINPKPTPFAVALDVSGSMGVVVEAMRKGLGVLFEQLIDRHPVPDPHVLAMVVDDMEVNAIGAIQVTQFEGDPVTIGKQIERLYLVGNGGGNDHESYLAPLYTAAMRFECDAFKEGRKGFLFTIGDEEPQLVLRKIDIQKYFGDVVQSDLTAEQLLAMVERNWHYHHLMVEEGSYMRGHRDRVIKAWTSLIGQRAHPLADHTKAAEVIISIAEVLAGRDKDKIIKSWSGDTSLVVSKAIGGLVVDPKHAGGPVHL